MDFALSDGQKLIIETVRRFVRQELAPLEAQVEAEGRLAPELARAIHAKARALGLYAMNVPAEWGGGGLSAIDTMLVEEQYGHTTDILIRRAFGNVYEALFACRRAQIERWLLPCVRGERVCSIAITEPGVCSSTASNSTATACSGRAARAFAWRWRCSAVCASRRWAHAPSARRRTCWSWRATRPGSGASSASRSATSR